MRKVVFISFIAAFLTTMTLVSCKVEDQHVEVTKITLNRNTLSLTKGNEAMLTANILPFSASGQKVNWQSNNPQIATVTNDGKVKAVALGKAVITAKAGEMTTECPVTVKKAIIGTYYFDGWAGKNSLANNPYEPWAANAPTHLTRRFVEEFPDREPVWGWRDDTQAIMERQIDLAADNGVDFFLFCWYWHDNKGYLNESAIKNDSKHTSLELYLTAQNKQKLQFCLLIANHDGAEIIGNDNWVEAVKYWIPYFRDPQYVTVDGKPLVVIFGTSDTAIDTEQLEKMQQVAIKEGLKNGLSIAGCGANATVRRKAFTHSTHYNIIPGYASGSALHQYSELVNATREQWNGTEQQPYIPLLTSGWDKRPWEGTNGLNQAEGWYFTDDTPEAFQSFLRDAFRWMDNNPSKTTKERLTLIYAWNELGEGGYLVPTKGDPEAAKLKKIKELLDEK